MIILIDGRSGSGKTELATLLAARLGAQVVRLDDVYPGWDGLDAGSAAVPGILSSGRWQRWDWATSQPAEWHSVDPDRALIVEGVGAITRASLPLADHALWVELDGETRKERALARDEYFAAHWDEWAAQEARLIAREDPRSLADSVVDGRAVEAFSLEWTP
ncbi:MAG: ATP-binding protein [Rhodoglobus sp.]|jgi:dephospho-CoA kinase|nr:ATP-binding protein [Rhodoglobus sp.]